MDTLSLEAFKLWASTTQKKISDTADEIGKKSSELFEAAQVKAKELSDQATVTWDQTTSSASAKWEEFSTIASQKFVEISGQGTQFFQEKADGYVADTSGTKRFGLPISVVCKKDGTEIPLLLVKIFAHMSEPVNLRTPGLFTTEVTTGEVSILKSVYDAGHGQGLRLPLYQIHVIANLLIAYLKELPSPIINYSLDHLNGLSNDEKLSTIRQILRNPAKVPRPNFLTAKELMKFLATLLENNQQNKLDKEKLSSIFGPLLIAGYPSNTAEFALGAFFETRQEIFESEDQPENEKPN